MIEEDDKTTKEAVIAKWMYMAYQSLGINAEQLSDEVLFKRVSGFEHHEVMFYKPDFFVGINHEEYLKECRIAFSSLYDTMKETESNIIDEKIRRGSKIHRDKHQGLKDFTESLTNEELDRLGAKTLEEKQYWMKRLAREYLLHLTNNAGVNLVMQPHCYKEENSDCHIQFSRFDKRGDLIKDWQLKTRMKRTLIYMHIKYPQLIPPPAIAEEVRLGAFRNISNSNAAKIPKDKMNEISNEILNSKAKFVSEFTSPFVSLKLITKSGYSKCLDRQNNIFETSKRLITGISIDYEGSEFYSNKLSPLADRKIQLMSLAEKLRDSLSFDVYELKDSIDRISVEALSYEDFCDKCLENNVKVLPFFNASKDTGIPKFAGFRFKHVGIKEDIKASLFDIDLLQRFSLDMNKENDKHRVLNKSIEHVESFAQFSAGELRFTKGDSHEAYLAKQRKKNKDKYILQFQQKGDEFFFGKSTHKSFDMNMKSGAAVLYKSGFTEINALADLYIKRGSKEVEVTRISSQSEFDLIFLTFGKKGVSIISEYVSAELCERLKTEILIIAVNRHKYESKYLLDAIEKGRKSINTMPFVADTGEVLSYENIWLKLKDCAHNDIELTKVPSKVFHENLIMLQERFKDDSVTLKYIKQKADRYSLNVDEKATEYVRLSTKKKIVRKG